MAQDSRTGESMRKFMMGLVVVLGFGLAGAVPVERGEVGGVEQERGGGVPGVPVFDCGFVKSEEALAAIEEAVAKGEMADPALRLPGGAFVLPQREIAGKGGKGSAVEYPAQLRGQQCVTPEDIFLFEDTEGLLLTNFSNAALFDLMSVAANELIGTWGDQFDFIGFWVNFTPDHTVGAAFYLGIENDVSGIGRGIFDNHAGFGLLGTRLQGYVNMWNVNSGFWAQGTGTGASDFTRLVLGQEFEHRFAMFLPDIAAGPGGAGPRKLQGDPGCGRGAHWNFRVDGQGSGMEIIEWVGSGPANRAPGDGLSPNLRFNGDIGGVFSYADLYLMGYVSSSEMDVGSSEFRYMDEGCGSPYNGTISPISSLDIINAAGARIPGSANAQKDFRTGWIMIHLPGNPPSAGELGKAAGILDQHILDWNFGTLGRGTMDNTLSGICNCVVVGGGADCNGNGVADDCEPDCNGNGIPNECDIASGVSEDCNGDGIPDECQAMGGDCNGNGLPDVCDIFSGASADCNGNGVPDECDVASGDSADLNGNGIPDECENFPVNNSCSTGLVVLEGATAFTNAEAFSLIGGEGCGTFTSDIWYSFITQSNCVMTASVCAANFDVELAVYDFHCPTGAGAALDCSQDACGTGATVSLLVGPGLYRIRISGKNGGQGSGTLTIACTPPPSCIEDITPPHGNGVVNIDDLVALLNGFGMCPLPPSPCPEDITPPGPPVGNGVVNIDDLVALLNAFGPCQ